ncbi:hypothetical protein RI129_010338 [Pyrocoelia pectoralis]|uniref:Tyr recombinase domain-containing protein n=1 Tax=Pyrocoelia pectoralis TaxID=417401 RepID=A0AAN7VB38_9COLE
MCVAYQTCMVFIFQKYTELRKENIPQSRVPPRGAKGAKKVKDVEIKPDVGIVKILQSKNKIPRSFVVTGCGETVNWLKILEKYMKLRPSNTKESKFFLRYGNGKCVRQVVGKHTLSAIPMKIAKFLNLNHCKDYTGHSFRRTSATLLANSGGLDCFIRIHSNSSTVDPAEEFLECSNTERTRSESDVEILQNLLISIFFPLQTEQWR